MKKVILAIILSISTLTSCVNPMVEKYRGDTNKPIIITDYYQVSTNSAGGIIVEMTAFNMTNKPIKYFDFWAKHYDRVAELQTDTITGKLVKAYRFTGPFTKEQAINGRFGPSFYNFSANCMVLDKVEVTYMDNSKDSFSGKKLGNVIVIKGSNCRNIWN